jgi:hypothetical protein
VLEHLCITDESYLVRLRERLPAAGRGTVDAEWAPRFAGKLLTNAMRAPRKLRAPKLYRPPAAPRADVLDAWLGRARELVALIERARGVELRAVSFGSPVFGLIRLNAGDALSLLAWHGRRHLGQVERIRGQAAFPAM